jgi:small subunit ribosomal protein S21
LEVIVRKNNVTKALRILKKKLEQDGIMYELRQRQFYEKPSDKKKREHKQNLRRCKKRDKERNNEEDRKG